MDFTCDDLINRPEVEAVVRNVLRKRRVPGDHMEDAVQEVKARALEATRNDRPDTVERWQKLCRTVASCYGVDAARRRSSSGAVIVGFTAHADDALDPANADADERIDVRRKLAALRDLDVAGGLHANTSEIVDAMQAGVPGPRIAEELGVSYRWLRTYLSIMRGRMRTTLAARGLVVVLLVWSFWYARRGAGVGDRPSTLEAPRASHQQDVGEATNPRPDEVRADSKATEDAGLADVHDRAAALLRDAEADRTEGRWSQCVTNTRRAIEVDPSQAKTALGIQAACEHKMQSRDSKSR